LTSSKFYVYGGKSRLRRGKEPQQLMRRKEPNRGGGVLGACLVLDEEGRRTLLPDTKPFFAQPRQPGEKGKKGSKWSDRKPYRKRRKKSREKVFYPMISMVGGRGRVRTVVGSPFHDSREIKRGGTYIGQGQKRQREIEEATLDVDLLTRKG